VLANMDPPAAPRISNYVASRLPAAPAATAKETRPRFEAASIAGSLVR
jgi:hypothetical protein